MTLEIHADDDCYHDAVVQAEKAASRIARRFSFRGVACVIHYDVPAPAAVPGDEVEAEAKERHLLHMTDGRWHDDCSFCQRRRSHGGTGVPAPADSEEVEHG